MVSVTITNLPCCHEHTLLQNQKKTYNFSVSFCFKTLNISIWFFLVLTYVNTKEISFSMYFFNKKYANQSALPMNIILDRCEAAGSNTISLATHGTPQQITKGKVEPKNQKFFSQEDLRRLQNERSFSDNNMR